MKMNMKKKNQLYTLGLALLFTAAFPACTQHDDEPGGQQPEGRILLSPAVGLEGWNKPGGADTRVDQAIAVALAPGGVLSVMLQTVTESGDKPAEAGKQMNRFEVTDAGKLSRIAYSGAEHETETALNIAAPGDYFVTTGGTANCVLDGITFRTVIGTADGAQKIDIDNAGKLSIPCVLFSGGLRLNVKDEDGSDYTSVDVTANLKNVQVYGSDTFEEKTLTAAAASALWGDIDPASSVAAGNTLMELAAGGQKYDVKAPRQITFGKGRLYTFNVRVGATSIIVSSDDLAIADFEVEASTDVDMVVTPSLNGHQAWAVNSYWAADASPAGRDNVRYAATSGLRRVCPAGWKLPSIMDIESMAGVKFPDNNVEVNIPDDKKTDLIAAFPFYFTGARSQGFYFGAFESEEHPFLVRFTLNEAQTTIRYTTDAATDKELTEDSDAGYLIRCVKEKDAPLYEGKTAGLLALSGAVPYYIAPVQLNSGINVAWTNINNYTCPPGWYIPSKEDVEAMLGTHANGPIPEFADAIIEGGVEFWTSTEKPEDPNMAFKVTTSGGSVGLLPYPKGTTTGLRCVRRK